ncbi:MAG: phosphopantetheine-binding protein [Desulfobacter sp.]
MSTTSTTVQMIEDTIKEMITECTSIEDIGLDTHLTEELGIDSSEMTEIALMLEQKFDIVIDEDKVKDIVTVRQWAEYLKPLINAS